MAPKLLRIENCLSDYTVKATISGVTVLRQNRFKKRYTGSKSHAVDINGKLYLNAKDLDKEIGKVSRPKGKKKPAGPPAGTEETIEIGYEDIENLPPHELSFLTNLPKFSTPVESPRKKTYKIHKREVRQRLLGMINSKAGKKELYFWTITFPKGTADNIAYRAFNTWLTTLRTRDKQGRRFLKNYLWVAERQENGTVHFHMAIPHKMPITIANGAMRTVLTTFAKAGVINFSVFQCKRYNGVDIAKNRNTRRVTNFAIKKGARALTTYLTKYLTKNDAEFEHLAWHNSRGFSALFTGVTFTESEFMRAGFKKDGVWLLYSEAVVPKDHPNRFFNEYFTFIPWEDGPPWPLVNHLYEINSYIQDLTTKN